jgi:ribosomal protein S18 acetylase RimI-like enzyme
MRIRNTTQEDLPAAMEIYAYARMQMKRNGNPNQWGDSRPTLETIEKDIRNNTSFLIFDERICGIFSFIIGEDPTYAVIEDGTWLNDKPYGVIHRLASNGRRKGIMDEVLAYCESQIDNIRIDTHRDNKIMQHLLERHGYTRCGTIYVEDGTPRIAYQKECNRGGGSV